LGTWTPSIVNRSATESSGSAAAGHSVPSEVPNSCARAVPSGRITHAPTAQNICASALDSDDAMHSVHGTPPGSTPSDVAGSDTHHDIMANTSSDSPSAYAIPSNTPPGSGPIRRGVSTAPVGNSVQNGR